MKTAFRNEFGIPHCPKCRVVVGEEVRFCPTCGLPLVGQRIWLKGLLRLATTAAVVTILLTLFQPRGSKTIPPEGSVTAQDTEIVVEPHATYWAMNQPKVTGELSARLTPLDDDLGLQVRLLDNSGVTQAVEEAVRKDPVPVEKGKTFDLVRTALQDHRYGIFVINESDARVRARLTIVYRWKGR